MDLNDQLGQWLIKRDDFSIKLVHKLRSKGLKKSTLLPYSQGDVSLNPSMAVESGETYI